MKRQKIFSWSYPRNLEELVQVSMVVVGVLFIGLVLTAARYNSYKNFRPDQTSLKQSATSLASLASEAQEVNQKALDNKVTENFRESYDDKVADEVDSVVGYVS